MPPGPTRCRLGLPDPQTQRPQHRSSSGPAALASPSPVRTLLCEETRSRELPSICHSGQRSLPIRLGPSAARLSRGVCHPSHKCTPLPWTLGTSAPSPPPALPQTRWPREHPRRRRARSRLLPAALLTGPGQEHARAGDTLLLCCLPAALPRVSQGRARPQGAAGARGRLVLMSTTSHAWSVKSTAGRRPHSQEGERWQVPGSPLLPVWKPTQEFPREAQGLPPAPSPVCCPQGRTQAGLVAASLGGTSLSEVGSLYALIPSTQNTRCPGRGRADGACRPLGARMQEGAQAGEPRGLCPGSLRKDRTEAQLPRTPARKTAPGRPTSLHPVKTARNVPSDLHLSSHTGALFPWWCLVSIRPWMGPAHAPQLQGAYR